MRLSSTEQRCLRFPSACAALALAWVLVWPLEHAHAQPAATPADRAAPSAPRLASKLRKGGPLRCTGTRSLRIRRMRIEASGHGVTARGRCKVIIEDSEIIAGGHGLHISDRVRVLVHRSTVRGKRGAVRMAGTSTVIARDTTFTGELERLDRATYRDQGGNSYNNEAKAEAQTKNKAGARTLPPLELPGDLPRLIARAPVPPLPLQEPGSAPDKGSRQPPGKDGGPSFAPAAPSAPTTPALAVPAMVLPHLEPSGPLRCRGDERLRVVGLRIEAAEDGITVRGRCKVDIRDSEILAGRAAIRVSGGGTITVRHSRVLGSVAALVLTSTARATLSASQVIGPIERQGEAALDDAGGNQFIDPLVSKPAASATPAEAEAGARAGSSPDGPDSDSPSSRELLPSGPIRCKGDETLRLDRLHIESAEQGVVATGHCRVVITNSRISAGSVAIAMSRSAEVTLERCRVEGQKAAVELSGQAELSAISSVFVGPITGVERPDAPEGQRAQRSAGASRRPDASDAGKDFTGASGAVLRDRGGNEWR